MRIKRNISQRGMTLLETIVTMAIIAVVLIPLTNLYLQTKQLTTSSSSELKAVYQAQSILEELKAREYSSVNSSNNWIELADKHYKILVTERNNRIKEVTVTVRYYETAKVKSISLTMLKANR